jgi:hypothetical protein
MRMKKRTLVNPSYFCPIIKEESETSMDGEFYAKGGSKHKNHSKHVRYHGKDTLVILGKNGEDDAQINLRDTRKYIQELRDEYATELISELKGRGKEAFESIYQLVQALKDSPAYEAIHDIIQKEFKCVEEHRYKIGTVGSFFCECKNSHDFPGNPNCSLGCLFGLKECGESGPCEHTCLSYLGDGSISLLQKVQGETSAYLFISSDLTFVGLRDVEIDQLKRLGITHVKIIRHTDGSDYKEVTTSFVPIHKLHTSSVQRVQPRRQSLVQNRYANALLNSYNQRNHNPTYGLGIVLLVIIVIVAIIIVIFVYQVRYSHSSYELFGFGNEW